MNMDPLNLAIAVATLLCSLVSGFLFSFAVVVMPGIRKLNDRGFLKSFKTMDRVIQNNQPTFMVVWLGSILGLIFAAALSVFQLDGGERLLVLAAAGIYLLGVQLPTIAINIPLNNYLQGLDLESMNEQEFLQARCRFEPNWVRWNTIRTLFSVLAASLLVIVAIRI